MPEPEEGAPLHMLAWLTAMRKLAGDGDERAAKALSTAYRTRLEMWDWFSSTAASVEEACGVIEAMARERAPARRGDER